MHGLWRRWKKLRHTATLTSLITFAIVGFSGVLAIETVTAAAHEAIHAAKDFQNTQSSTPSFREPECQVCLAYRTPVRVHSVLPHTVSSQQPQSLLTLQTFEQVTSGASRPWDARGPPRA